MSRPTPRAGSTYGEALRSTAVIGGSSLINVALSLLRNKALAILLGPAGVGAMGLYTAVAELANSLAGFGIQSSGVRQIAESGGSGDIRRVAVTAAVLKRTAAGLGLLGGAAVALSSGSLATVTFGSGEQANLVACLGFVVLFRQVAAGQTALIQGMRRISHLARFNVASAALGTAFSIGLIAVLGQRGIVPSLVAVAAVGTLTSWYYSRKIELPKPIVSLRMIRGEARALLRLGFAFMATAFLTTGAAYAIRIIVLRTAGLEAAGFYQAAWAIGGLYVGFVLQAMGADFYPRLTAVSRDNVECNRIVNEQAQVSLLIAGPGVIATLTLAPLVIAVLCTSEFAATVSLLRWICLGMALRVVAWPMGFIVVAKGAQHAFLATETAAALVHVGLAWWLVPRVGVDGAGIAFFGLYAWHTVLIYVVVRRMSGFRWSTQSKKIGVVFGPLTAVVFIALYAGPVWLGTSVGVVGSVLAAVYSARVLLELVPPESVPGAIRPLLLRLRLAAA